MYLCSGISYVPRLETWKHKLQNVVYMSQGVVRMFQVLKYKM